MRINSRCYKIRKIPSLVDFHSLYQLLHSHKVYRDGLKLWISNVKFGLISEGESNRKLPKVFASKNLGMTQKTFTHWFNQKTWRGVLKYHELTLKFLWKSFPQFEMFISRGVTNISPKFRRRVSDNS